LLGQVSRTFATEFSSGVSTVAADAAAGAAFTAQVSFEIDGLSLLSTA